jgi:hypothetical protein
MMKMKVNQRRENNGGIGQLPIKWCQSPPILIEAKPQCAPGLVKSPKR